MNQKREEPVKRIRLEHIGATIWANRSANGKVWHNVTLSRSYRDGVTWKEASGFRRDDLPILAKVLDMAYDWIWAQQVQSAPDEPVANLCEDLAAPCHQ